MVSSSTLDNFLEYGSPLDFLFIFRPSYCLKHNPGHLGLTYTCEPMERGRQHCPHSTGREVEVQRGTSEALGILGVLPRMYLDRKQCK